jgi:hypothetical protein
VKVGNESSPLKWGSLPSFEGNGDGSGDKVAIRRTAAALNAGGADVNHETSNKGIHQRDWKLETFAPLGRPARRCSFEGRRPSYRTVSCSVWVLKAKLFSSSVKSHQCPRDVSIFNRLNSCKYEHFTISTPWRSIYDMNCRSENNAAYTSAVHVSIPGRPQQNVQWIWSGALPGTGTEPCVWVITRLKSATLILTQCNSNHWPAIFCHISHAQPRGQAQKYSTYTHWPSGQLSRYSDGLQAGQLGFESWQGKFFLFSTASRPVPGPTQSHIECVPGAIWPRANRPGRETDYSPVSSGEVKNDVAIRPLVHMSSWHSA